MKYLKIKPYEGMRRNERTIITWNISGQVTHSNKIQRHNVWYQTGWFVLTACNTKTWVFWGADSDVGSWPTQKSRYRCLNPSVRPSRCRREGTGSDAVWTWSIETLWWTPIHQGMAECAPGRKAVKHWHASLWVPFSFLCFSSLNVWRPYWQMQVSTLIM